MSGKGSVEYGSVEYDIIEYGVVEYGREHCFERAEEMSSGA